MHERQDEFPNGQATQSSLSFSLSIYLSRSRDLSLSLSLSFSLDQYMSSVSTTRRHDLQETASSWWRGESQNGFQATGSLNPRTRVFAFFSRSRRVIDQSEATDEGLKRREAETASVTVVTKTVRYAKQLVSRHVAGCRRGMHRERESNNAHECHAPIAIRIDDR